MTSPEIQQNNPLHGLKLETLLNEIVDHYGWEILADAINVNCFKQNPSIASSLKFLRKTEWAQEKVEAFYLYQFKSLPKPDDEQYELPPRQRTIPLDQTPGEPEDIWVGKFAERRAHKAKRRENQKFQNNEGKHTRNKKSYASTFSDNKKNKPFDNDANNETKKDESGFVNPWRDEHY